MRRQLWTVIKSKPRQYRQMASSTGSIQRVDLTGKHVVIVGGVAGGASCAARLRRLSEAVSITMLERSSAVSFANCGLPYLIGNTITERSKLVLHTPQSFKSRFQVDALVHSECTSINRKEKRVTVKNVISGDLHDLPYDYLVLACGASPVSPPIKGNASTPSKGVFSLRTLDDLDAIMEYLKINDVKSAAVIGGGFIGLEMAENFVHRGIPATIIEKVSQVMPMLDPEIASYAENELRRNKVELRLKCGATEISSADNAISKTILLDDGSTPIVADIVILAVGVRPDTALAEASGLKLSTKTKGIEVDDQMRTSDPNIFAVGDSVEIYDRVARVKSRIALAGPANRQGRVAADVIAGIPSRYPGGLGTNIVKVFDLSIGSVGLTEQRTKALKMDNVRYAHAVANQHAGYYPGSSLLLLKGAYTYPEGRLVGAQVVGRCEGVDKRIDVMATAIVNNMSVYDLQYLDLAYAPPYGSAKDPVNHLATICVDHLQGLHPTVAWDELDILLGAGAQLVDVRTKSEFAAGSIQSAKLIPLDDLRSRLDELDKGKEIVVFCRVGMRGYLATRLLQEHGFKHVRNLLGGYSLYSEVSQANKLPQHPLATSTNHAGL